MRAGKSAETQKNFEELREVIEQLALANTAVNAQNKQVLDNINNVEAASGSSKTENQRLQLKVDDLTTTVLSLSDKIAERISKMEPDDSFDLSPVSDISTHVNRQAPVEYPSTSEPDAQPLP